MVTVVVLGPSKCCYGYMIMLRSTNVLRWLRESAEDYKDCFGGYKGRLYENHQVGLEFYGLRTFKVL